MLSWSQMFPTIPAMLQRLIARPPSHRARGHLHTPSPGYGGKGQGMGTPVGSTPKKPPHFRACGVSLKYGIVEEQ
jgi:hypothetical protein